MLRQAIKESVKAGDLDLAYQITACKSYIVGHLRKMPGRDDAFREAATANEKALGRDVYSILDGVHFSLAMKVGNIPSGMLVIGHTRDGRTMGEQMAHMGEHPIVQRIKYEDEECARRARAR